MTLFCNLFIEQPLYTVTVSFCHIQDVILTAQLADDNFYQIN